MGSHYDHMFVIVEENHGFSDVIGNPAAPNLNALANQFGLATDYFGISHPSEPNYMALLGGNTFGVNSDNPYYTNAVSQPSLIQQLDKANVSRTPSGSGACSSPATPARSSRSAPC